MIEKFNINDIDEIMSIWLNSNIDAHSFIDKSYWENNYDLVKELLPQADIFVYKEDQTIKGFIGISDQSYIAGLFVDKKYRSEGIGRQLIEYTKSIYNELHLDVFVRNTGAVNFYTKNGFIISQTKMNDDINEEEYHMIYHK